MLNVAHFSIYMSEHKLTHTAMKMLLLIIGVALGHFLFHAPVMLQVAMAFVTALAAYYFIEWNDNDEASA